MREVNFEISPMAHSTNRLIQFYGSSPDTHTLIAKAVLKGAQAYQEFEELQKYNNGTVLANRAEAICIQQELYGCLRRSHKNSARVAAKLLLPSNQVCKHSQEQYNQSHILEELVEKLKGNSQERRYQLITFGEEISLAQANTPYMGREKINVTALKPRRASNIEKALFREFGRIKSIVDQL